MRQDGNHSSSIHHLESHQAREIVNNVGNEEFWPLVFNLTEIRVLHPVLQILHLLKGSSTFPQNR